MKPEAFFTLHRDLPREGPGDPDDVHWALQQIPTPARVLDAACGPGADTLTLAAALPAAQMSARDQVAHFAQAATERPASFGARVAVAQGDMFDAPGPFDLIWCAGAAYFEGVTESLTRFAAQLAPGGHVAFSEPVKPGPTAPQAAHDFWAEYPAITTADGIEARVTAAGFRTLATRLIVGAPWAAYYDPLAGAY